MNIQGRGKYGDNDGFGRGGFRNDNGYQRDNYNNYDGYKRGSNRGDDYGRNDYGRHDYNRRDSYNSWGGGSHLSRGNYDDDRGGFEPRKKTYNYRENDDMSSTQNGFRRFDPGQSDGFYKRKSYYEQDK